MKDIAKKFGLYLLSQVFPLIVAMTIGFHMGKAAAWDDLVKAMSHVERDQPALPLRVEKQEVTG